VKLVNIGILGNASIAKKSIIPTLLSMPEKFSLKGIASQSYLNQEFIFGKEIIDSYNSYSSLIKDENIDAIYIPLPNSMHAEWIEKSLDHDLHVLVEKPLSTNLIDVKRLNDIALHKNLVLMENFQFRFHKQLSLLKDLLKKNEIGQLRCLKSSFGFPPLDDNGNIRYQRALGGGALLDAGVYPLKISSIFLKNDISVSSSILNYDDKLGVDIWGGGHLVQNNGKLFSQISFGFDNFYQCSIELWGSAGKLSADRIFTAPAEEKQIINLENGSGRSKIEVPPDNQFLNMLNHFHKLIFSKNLRNSEYDQNVTQGKLIQEMIDKSNVS
tara:strand:- start:3741 stop:4721 length:981 start_codon:yes stop_codon:yes gene_type:complete